MEIAILILTVLISFTLGLVAALWQTIKRHGRHIVQIELEHERILEVLEKTTQIIDVMTSKYDRGKSITNKELIDKAVNFLEMLGYGFTITDNITHSQYESEQLIEDFKEFIKEEGDNGTL